MRGEAFDDEEEAFDGETGASPHPFGRVVISTAPHEQYFVSYGVSPAAMDALWASGWRHFGIIFFRYRRATVPGGNCTVVPLRVDLERFTLSRSQRRIVARNRDARVVVGETSPAREKEELFERHKRRFRENVPESLSDFLSHAPARVPCRNEEICVYLEDRLVAASFLDVGSRSTSAVYAMFDPAESRRSLGIYTMLLSIRRARDLKCRYYYPGYACAEPSVYDYKKRFAGLERYDWRGGWHPLVPGVMHS